MTSQFGPETDAHLNALSKYIGTAEADIELATERKDIFWSEVFDTMDEFAKEGKQAKFLASDGYFLFKQPVNRAPKLDETKLYALLYEKYPAGRAKQLWDIVTERKVNSVALEQAIQQHKIPAELVDQCLTVPETTYNRIRKLWSKDDIDRAVMLGIQIQIEE